MARRGANQGSITAVGSKRWGLKKITIRRGPRKWIDETLTSTKKQVESRMGKIKDKLKIGVVLTGHTLSQFLDQWLLITKQTVKPKTHYD